MAGNGNTDRELLLQLNDRLMSFIADSKADRAVLNEKMDSIKQSIAVINHNSTLLADRVGKLETVNKTTTDYKDFAKKIGITLAGVAGFVVTLLTILSLLGIL
jgi:hypothetical protein